jgi:hypothetical protein
VWNFEPACCPSNCKERSRGCGRKSTLLRMTRENNSLTMSQRVWLYSSIRSSTLSTNSKAMENREFLPAPAAIDRMKNNPIRRHKATY